MLSTNRILQLGLQENTNLDMNKIGSYACLWNATAENIYLLYNNNGI